MRHRHPLSRLGVLFATLALVSGCGGTATPAASSASATKPAESAAASAPAKPAASPVASAPATAKPAAPASGEGLTVKVAVQGRPDQAGLQLGIDRGYFAKQGLNIVPVQIDSGAQMVPALATDQVQVGNGAPSASLFNALNRGIDIRMVADYAHVGGPDDTTLAIMLRKQVADSGAIKSITDLQGRPFGMGTVKGTASDYMLGGALKKANVTWTDQSGIQYMPFPDILAGLGSGKLDAGALTEPVVTQAVQQGIATVFLPSGQAIPGAHLSVLQYSPAFASNQTDAGKRFMVAYLQGVRDYLDAFFGNKDRDAAIKQLSTSLSLKDPKIWALAHPESIDPNGKVNLDDLKAQAQFFSAQGTLQGGVPDIAKYVDTRFAEAAVQQLGTRS
jgi:NitT/TauT family transport system substrate-binding protein